MGALPCLAHGGDGVIALFRNKSQAATASVQIAVMPRGKFKLRSVMSNKDLGVFTQAEFRQGIAVQFSASVEVLEISAIA